MRKNSANSGIALGAVHNMKSSSPCKPLYISIANSLNLEGVASKSSVAKISKLSTFADSTSTCRETTRMRFWCRASLASLALAVLMLPGVRTS